MEESIIFDLKKLKTNELKKIYNKVCQRLNKSKPLTTVKTIEEIIVAKKIKASAKVDIFQSTWIGPYCFDLFIPAIHSEEKHSMKGLVIEINGSVHNKQFKMKSDENKLEYLSKLRIGLTVINNSSLSTSQTQSFIGNLCSQPMQNRSKINELLKVIYIQTILDNPKIYSRTELQSELNQIKKLSESSYKNKYTDTKLFENNNKWMCSKEAADFLRISQQNLRTKVSRGQIKVHGKLGRNWRFRRDKLNELLESQTNGDLR